MAAIPNQTILSKLTVPGTHDSCTFNASAISKCQNLALDAQLNAGIRCIDIRCRQFNNTFELHHGREYLGMNFSYVLTTCLSFLQAHAGECIIMSVKEEHDPAGNTMTFQQVFTEYMQPNVKSWYLGNTIPALSAVRGKMVLLRRFYIEPNSDPTVWGIDLSAWPENTTFTLPNP
jgi:1-phosphatidylinositol phosphodiesterase